MPRYWIEQRLGSADGRMMWLVECTDLRTAGWLVTLDANSKWSVRYGVRLKLQSMSDERAALALDMAKRDLGAIVGKLNL